MSTDDQDQAETETPQPTTESSERTGFQEGLDWVGKHWPRVRLGHEGMMLDKIMRQQQFVEQDAKNAMTGNLNGDEYLPDEDDGVGVRIGDEYNYYGGQPEAPQQPIAPQPVTPPTPPPEPLTPQPPVFTPPPAQPPPPQPVTVVSNHPTQQKRAIWPYVLAGAMLLPTVGGLGYWAGYEDTNTQYELGVSGGARDTSPAPVRAERDEE